MNEISLRSAGPPTLPIAVIGGGVTGLAAAYHLAKRGKRVRLFEASPRLGGAVQSERVDGWLIEAGPNSLQENTRGITALIQELGLDRERVVTNPSAKKRFLVRGGKLLAVPHSPVTLLTTRLFSWRSKVRLVTEIFMRRRPRTSDLSLAELVEEHFGKEIVDYALNPFVSGVYAGDPEKLSARYAFPSVWDADQHYGSLIRGTLARSKARKALGQPRPQMISFRDGLHTLVDAFTTKLPAETIALNAKIESLIPGSPWRVGWEVGGESQTEEFASVILAAPAASLARIVIGSAGERPLAPLEAIAYPPVASLFLGYRRDQVGHPLDGFGALIPAAEKRSVLGVLFSSSLFPERAPDGHVALTVMVGGSVQPQLAGKTAEEIEAAVLPDLTGLLRITGKPMFRKLNVWPRAIPQYQIGYERFFDQMSACEKQFPGLHIGGSVRDGISLPCCLDAGAALAERVLAGG